MRIENSWPEILQKLAIEQAKVRQKLINDHCFERERLFEYGEKEYLRLLNNTRLTLSNKEINISTKKFDKNNIIEILVRLFRESECYNPETIGLNESTHIALNKAQLLQRLKNMSYTTKNRQILEAQSLFVCQVSFFDYFFFNL